MKYCFFFFLMSLTVFSCKKEEKEEQDPVVEVPDSQQVTDIDGNVYKTVKIGTKTWMAENLKTSKHNNGTVIANVTDQTEWANLTTGAYCLYENSTAYGNSDGKLYNWQTASTSDVCPTGWHLPSIAEWHELSEALGGDAVAGKKLKSSTAIFEPFFTPTGTNESGFNAIPAGSRYVDGNFSMRGSFALFWSSTEVDVTNVNYTSLSADDDLFFGTAKKANGFSIRCVKN